jgi:hypothetical protein
MPWQEDAAGPDTKDADMLKTAATLLLAIPLLASPCLGQTNDKAAAETVRVKFIDMSGMDITAGPVKVPGAYISARGREQFARLVRLKRSVLPKMKATAKDVALR